MGQRGPAKTPTALQLLRGNPGKRTPNKREPKPAPGRPAKTGLLKGDEAAERHYRDLVKITEGMRTLTTADGRPLEKVAFMEARFDELADMARESGFLVANKQTGMVHINPIHKEMKEIMAHLWRAYKEFGFTPSSRAGMQATDGERTESKFTKFISG